MSNKSVFSKEFLWGVIKLKVDMMKVEKVYQ